MRISISRSLKNITAQLIDSSNGKVLATVSTQQKSLKSKNGGNIEAATKVGGEIAKKAMENLDIVPFSKPIRGGTDGSLLTELGIPTPNLFTGMQNIHGPLEWISAQDMEKATNLCLEIIKEFSKEN